MARDVAERRQTGKRTPAVRGPKEVAQSFAHRVKRIPEVVDVVAVQSDGGLCIWTLLTDDPHSSARHSIYRLELLTQQEHPDVVLDFRLINADDFPEDRRPYLLPTNRIELYHRPASPDREPEAALPRAAVTTAVDGS